MRDYIQVAWIEDAFALSVFEDLGLKHSVLALDISEIDRKASSQNAARLSARLDEENVSSLVIGIQQGDRIPYLVVRKVLDRGRARYVVAGGNHRLEAMTRCGCEDVKAYCVECGDTEFLVLCQRLNLANGKGVSEKDRVMYAAAAVASGTAENQRVAAEMFRVSPSKLKEFIRNEKAEQKLIARIGRSIKIPSKVKLALSKIQVDEVHDAAIELATSKDAREVDVVKVITDAIQQPSVDEQLGVIKKAQLSVRERKVVSPQRRVFLAGVSTIDRVLQKHSTLLSLDVVNDKDAVIESIQSLITKLKGLIK